MVRKRGLIGRTWDRLSDQRKLGVIMFCVTNVLFSLLLLVPKIGPVFVGIIYSVELLAFMIIGVIYMLPEEGW